MPTIKNVRQPEQKMSDVFFQHSMMRGRVPPFAAGRPVDSHSFFAAKAYLLHYDTWLEAKHTMPHNIMALNDCLKYIHISSMCIHWDIKMKYKLL